MYDDNTVTFPMSMSTADYFVLVELARKSDMTRTQYILHCIKRTALQEQEEWAKKQAPAKPKTQEGGEQNVTD